MRHSTFVQVTAMVLALGWSQGQAVEGDYPAAHFDPKVIYRAEVSPAAASSSETSVDTRYPAANFVPRVIYQDPALIESVRAQPVPPVPDAVEGVLPSAGEEKPSSRPRGTTRTEGGAISDVTPPYGMLLLVLGVVGLAFWWASRSQSGAAVETPEERADAPEESEGGEQEVEEEDEDLETLAEEAEAALAHNNRQRANKTRRTRRR